MSSSSTLADAATINEPGASDTPQLVHPLYVRVTHWINALAILIMISCILQIGAFIILVPAIAWVWFTKDTTAALIFTRCVSARRARDRCAT